MNAESTQAIAEKLRSLIGQGQAMVILSTGAQLPLEVVSVGRLTITAKASMQVTRQIMGQPVVQEVPWLYELALEAVIGVGAQAGELETLEAGSPNGLIDIRNIKDES